MHDAFLAAWLYIAIYNFTCMISIYDHNLDFALDYSNVFLGYSMLAMQEHIKL